MFNAMDRIYVFLEYLKKKTLEIYTVVNGKYVSVPFVTAEKILQKVYNE